MRYRREIDGLRAVAVCGVILYHAGINTFAQGFLGVDVFFVISGYLITGILATDLQAGSFSVWRFYERRIRRIIPALVVVMAVCTPIAFRTMLPDDLENFGQSLTATALFANNILLLLTSGYFELENSLKPLMHTWSLGVEEQYYVFAPLLLFVSFKIGARRGLLWAMAVVSIGSLALSLWASSAMPVANFLLLPFRAWELGVGAVAFLTQEHVRNWIPVGSPRSEASAAVGLLCVAIALTGFGPQGVSVLSAIVPVIGTTLVLLFGHERAGVGRVLAMKPIVAVGLISYSLYLYHQPVFAFARIVSLEPPAPFFLLMLTPLIFGLAWLSWRYVELPFRNRQRMAFRPAALFLSSASAGLMALGLLLHLNSGFYSQWAELDTVDAQFGAKQNIAFNFRPLTYLDRRFDSHSPYKKVLVVGDSFGRDFINMAVESKNTAGLEFSYEQVDLCASRFDSISANQTSGADFIVYASTVAPACIARWIEEAAKVTRAKQMIIGTKNFGWNNDAVMLLPSPGRYQTRVKPLPDVVALNETCAATFDPAVYVNILQIISDESGRVPVFTPERKFISQDRSHLTKAGAAYVGHIVFANHPALSDMAKVGREAYDREHNRA